MSGALVEFPHTFLVHPGRWIAAGTATGEDGFNYEAVGETVIEHGADDWTVTGTLRVASDPPVSHGLTWHVDPFDFCVGIAEWSADHPDFGPVVGRLLVIEDVIHTQFRSPDGRFSGVERLKLLKDGTYKATGGYFDGAKRRWAWDVTLGPAMVQ